MLCSQCGAENHDGRRFCAGCGSALAAACGECGFVNEAGDGFCGGCGMTLGAAPEAAREQPTAPPEAERRQLTVMFVDLVGSTALSERLDPEDLRDVLRAYQETCAEAVGRFDGHIAKYIGDGLLIYFGYPQAHEDDAQRAVRAGLGIVEGVAALSRRLTSEQGIALGVRVGVHTGLVVAGEMGGGETREQHAIVGETPNIAARLEALAEPGSVAISGATQRLVDGLFECDELGAKTVKGISDPVTVFRVRGESAAPSRFEAAAERGLTPLVGREEEVALLMKRWEQARDGEGQVVLLSGEAGVGKSRIMRAFRERLEGEPHSRVLYYGSAYHQNSAFYPAIDQLSRGLRFARDEGPAEKLAKLEALLNDLELPVAEHLPLHAHLISVPTDDRYPALELGPQQLKQKTIEAVAAVYEAMAARVPVLMVVEDAHWIDPSTVELLGLLIERLPDARVLILVTFRPEFESPWSGQPHLTLHALNRLGRRDCEAMVGKVTGGKTLPHEVLDQIVAKTDGVPLYVEELTKTVLESGVLEEDGDGYVLTGPLPPLAIPDSLQDSLMARLDRMAPVKEVAQLAAVLGRSFGRELLAAVSPLGRPALDDALDRLVEAELVYRRGLAPDETFEFKHALVRDAAYQSLLKSARQQRHGRIAQVLEEAFPGTAETQPELLAHHYTEANLVEQAVAYWQRAGRRAAERSANAEAIAHLTKGLALLESLPETPERDAQELATQIVLGPALLSVRGFGDPGGRHAYQRASELAEQLGDSSRQFTALWGLWIYNVTTDRFREACQLSADLIDLSGRQPDQDFVLQARHAAWTTDLFAGDFSSCWDHARKGIDAYDPEAHRAHKFLYGGHDPGVCGKSFGAMAQWLLGQPDKALAASEDAMALGGRIGHPNSHVQGLAFGSWLRRLRGEPDAAAGLAEAAVALSTAQGIGMWIPMGTILAGWAVAEGEALADGIEQMRRGLDAYAAAGAGSFTTVFAAALADAVAKTGAHAEALTLLTDAKNTMAKTGARWADAEIHRVRGETLLRQSADDREEAVAELQEALEIARRQKAKSFELRAATSLARLWGEDGRREEAREVLAPVYGWFTEGFETADLRDAKALLGELG